MENKTLIQCRDVFENWSKHKNYRDDWFVWRAWKQCWEYCHWLLEQPSEIKVVEGNIPCDAALGKYSVSRQMLQEEYTTMESFEEWWKREYNADNAVGYNLKTKEKARVVWKAAKATKREYRNDEAKLYREKLEELLNFTKGKPIGSDLYTIHMAIYGCLRHAETIKTEIEGQK